VSLPYEFVGTGEVMWFVELSPVSPNHPYQVYTREPDGVHHMYDIEPSRSSRGYLVALTGGGPPALRHRAGKWWGHPDLDLATVRVYGDKSGYPLKGVRPDPKNRVGDNHLVSPPKSPLILLGSLGSFVEESERIVYCGYCNDFYDAPDGDVVCRHVSWCRECRLWSTPDERCDHDKRKPYRGKR